MSDDEIQAKRLNDEATAAAEKLIEFCDSVIIIATMRESGYTHVVDVGRGNHYAVDGSLDYVKAKRAWQDRQNWKSQAKENEE